MPTQWVALPTSPAMNRLAQQPAVLDGHGPAMRQAGGQHIDKECFLVHDTIATAFRSRLRGRGAYILEC